MLGVVENSDEELWHRMPEELLAKIFARLPFRCIFRTRLLSKAWNEHAQSPSFRLEATSKVLSTWESYSPVLCSSMQKDMSMVAYSSAARRWERLFSLSYVLDDGPSVSSSSWQMKSIAGSLLCLKQAGEPRERGILVTNPVLKTWRLLPPHGLMTLFLPAYEIIHLVTSDEAVSLTYKVVSISQDSRILDPHKRIPSVQEPLLPAPHLRAEIYDSATGAWTVDESGPVVPTDLHNVSSVFVDGFVYFSLATSRYESFHLFAYNVTSGRWTTIPCADEAGSLVQLAQCGSRVMLIMSSSARQHRASNFGPSIDESSNISEGTLNLYEIGPDLNKITKVSGRPAECIQGVKVVAGVSGDKDCIFLQAFGRPLVVMFHVKLKQWSTLALDLQDGSHNVADDSDENFPKMSCRYFGRSFNWTNLTFQPGANSLVAA